MSYIQNDLKNYFEGKDNLFKDELLFLPFGLNYRTFVFKFVNKDESLFISLNDKDPSVFIEKIDNFYTSINSLFLSQIKSLGQLYFKKIEVINSDSIIKVTTQNDLEEYFFYIELFKIKPNFIITNNKNEVLFSYKKVDYETYQNSKKPEFEGNFPYKTSLFLKILDEEILQRRKEKYGQIFKYANSKIKQLNKKISNIQNDIETAKNNLSLAAIANEILSSGIDLKSRVNEVDINAKKFTLDPSKTVYQNCEQLFKKCKKAKITLDKSKENIEFANEEIKLINELIDLLKKDEKTIDDNLYKYNLGNKKHETKETKFNVPYYLNYNGTIILFGKNKEQNDYLSFAMKLDREFTWLHIKNLSGSHIIIKNKKLLDKELLLACELSLYLSHQQAGEISYTKKKNVRKGHEMGEAILKNYTTIKLNNIRPESIEFFKTAKRAEL